MGNSSLLPGLGVDHQQRIAAAVVEQPDEHDVAALAVDGGDGAAVVADGRGHAVVQEAVAQVLRRGGGRLDRERDQQQDQLKHEEGLNTRRGLGQHIGHLSWMMGRRGRPLWVTLRVAATGSLRAGRSSRPGNPESDIHRRTSGARRHLPRAALARNAILPPHRRAHAPVAQGSRPDAAKGAPDAHIGRPARRTAAGWGT